MYLRPLRKAPGLVGKVCERLDGKGGGEGSSYLRRRYELLLVEEIDWLVVG